ncbi:SURF1 family protein [Vibrio pectenicida]|uniref:SURF1-like protein n=1 Tax=Vibrio pectenicida TaxID=62763 RepID=A0A7Y3ZXC0_9VIBR|nr:SURF1 family protein [Vibrio pectenicida]
MTKSSSSTNSDLKINTIKFSLPRSLKKCSVWVGLLLTLAVFFTLVNLGFWQLARAQEKQVMEQVLSAREQSAVIGIDELHLADFTYVTGVKVAAKLSPIKGRYLLLDNQIYQGEVGYLAYQLMESEKGMKVLLERGFLPASTQREQLPKVAWLTAPINITARLYQRSANPLSDNLYMETSIPHRIQNLNIERLTQIWGYSIQPYVLQPIASEWPYPQPWQPVPLSSTKHFGYSIQWFSMAAALLILSLWVTFRLCKGKE